MTCRTCHHADRKSDEKMLAQGFARCHLRQKWQYQAPTYTCEKWRAKQ